jgi:hypothetical protein
MVPVFPVAQPNARTGLRRYCFRSVSAFGGFAQMLESTYMATHSSFFGMFFFFL